MIGNKFKFSTEVNSNDIYNIINKNYGDVVTEFYELQRGWLFRAYSVFKDLDKYLILISLINKTFESYSEYLIKYNYDEFYSVNQYELKKFNIVHIARELSISKETARRKILELEKKLIIMKDKKEIVITKYGLEVQRPTGSIKSFTKLLSRFSRLLVKNKHLDKEVKPDEFERIIKNNFTQFWHYFYEFQIPYLLKWKKYFGELEKWIVIGSLAYNQNLVFRNNRKDVIDNISFGKNMLDQIAHLKNVQGLNAMTISDLSGIPRPTVLRKLNSLMKSKHASKDKKNLYTVTKDNIKLKELDRMRYTTVRELSLLLSKYFNFIIQSRT
mgnify:CR=1 FL=1